MLVQRFSEFNRTKLALRGKKVSWAINVTKGVMFTVLTIHKWFQVEMSQLPAKMAKHVCLFSDLKSTMMKWN